MYLSLGYANYFCDLHVQKKSIARLIDSSRILRLPMEKPVLGQQLPYGWKYLTNEKTCLM